MKKTNIFKGKVAWITGASSGIGESLVYEFIKQGSVVIASSNDLKGLERVKAACGEKSDMVHCVPFDLAETAGIDKIVDEQIRITGGIDFLLNIGGISQRARIDETPLWLDRKIFEINYFGTIALTKAVLPYMIRQTIRSYSCNKQYIRKIWVSLFVQHIQHQNRLFMVFLKHFTLKIKNSILDLQ